MVHPTRCSSLPPVGRPPPTRQRGASAAQAPGAAGWRHGAAPAGEARSPDRGLHLGASGPHTEASGCVWREEFATPTPFPSSLPLSGGGSVPPERTYLHIDPPTDGLIGWLHHFRDAGMMLCSHSERGTRHDVNLQPPVASVHEALGRVHQNTALAVGFLQW